MGERRRNGRALFGERNGAAKLTAADVAQIRQDIANGYTKPKIATAYGVSLQAIKQIANRVTWRHVP